MTTKRQAAPDGHQEAAQEAPQQRTNIVPTRTRWGNCVGCFARIDLRLGVMRCARCAAWRRWYVAHRLASQALREASR